MYRRTLLLFLVLLFTGCFGGHRRSREPVAVGPGNVTIQYLGHASFRVSSSIGLSVLLDPFDPSLFTYSVKVASVPADIIFVTHEDQTSNYTDLASGSPQIFRSSMAAGINRASGILAKGIRTSSENLSASSRLNVAFAWAMDGIRFCDLGAIEDAISPSEALNIGTVDVLFLPVGGPPNFTQEKRRITVERLKPRIVIPMMYATSHSGKVPLGSLGEWLSRQPHVVRVGSTFTLNQATLPLVTTVYVATPR
ncbi:MAG: MBL fold metallo-hydrolase [Verrucomicrobia bacterium]|nr:MBL fold metallo-hydrolase [Verrucomicrobiota bacterium]MBV9674302.1 MBL fold metallo-hydrolase [Verrucomicrobiota bacterium]